MGFKTQFIKAIDLGIKTVGHIIALEKAGESVPAIVAEEAVTAIQGIHDRMKEHRDTHANDDDDEDG